MLFDEIQTIRKEIGEMRKDFISNKMKNSTDLRVAADRLHDMYASSPEGPCMITEEDGEETNPGFSVVAPGDTCCCPPRVWEDEPRFQVLIDRLAPVALQVLLTGVQSPAGFLPSREDSLRMARLSAEVTVEAARAIIAGINLEREKETNTNDDDCCC